MFTLGEQSRCATGNGYPGVINTMFLSEYSHLLPDCVVWTHLPDGLEQAYRRSARIRQDTLTTDKAGLVACLIGGMLFNGYITLKHGYSVAWHIGAAIHAITAILQLTYMRKRPRSYLKRRNWIALLHRARAWAVRSVAESTPLGQFTHYVHPPPDSWSACFFFAMHRSFLKAFDQLYHPLPAFPLLLVSSMSLMDAMLFGPPFVRHLIPEFQLQNKARLVCHMTHSLLTLPWSLVDSMAGSSAELLHCSPGYIEYVFVFTLCYQIVILLPLGPTFLLERASKAAFLTSLGPRKPQWARQLLDRYRPPSWPDILLTTWLCLLLPWMAVALLCRLLAAG